jgi:hypothetical protein
VRPAGRPAGFAGAGRGQTGGMVTVPERIVCVECQGTCHRLGAEPDGGFGPGDWVAYRCADCMDRFDVQVAEPADEAPAWEDLLPGGGA